MTKKLIILREAARLFAEKGFIETSTAQIAEAAGTAHGTVFYHFKTKEGILKEIYHNLVSDYLDSLSPIADGADTGLDGIKAILEFHFDYAKKHEAEFTVLHRDMPAQITYDERYEVMKCNTAKTIKCFRDCILKGINDGSIRPDADADGYAALFKALLVGTTRMTHLNLIEFATPDKVVIDFCMNALINRGCK